MKNIPNQEQRAERPNIQPQQPSIQPQNNSPAAQKESIFNSPNEHNAKSIYIPSPAQTPLAASPQIPVAINFQHPSIANTQSPPVVSTKIPVLSPTQIPVARNTQSPPATNTQNLVVTNTQSPAQTNTPIKTEENTLLNKQVSKWNDEDWNTFFSYVQKGLSGEQLMKRIGLERKKDLESLFYKLAIRKNTMFMIAWNADSSNNEHALPDLKVSKDGALRISSIRFQRYGFNVPAGTYFEMEKVSDTEIKLSIFSST